MKILRLLTLSILLGVFSVVQGQKEFSSDSLKFFRQIESLLNGADKEKFKPILNEFEPLWLSPKFKPEVRKSIYKIANLMSKKRMRPEPDFEAFILALNGYASGSVSDNSFNNWVTTTEELLNGRNKSKLSVFLKSSALIFGKKSFSETAIFYWTFNDAEYEFAIEGKVPVVIFSKDFELSCVSKKKEKSISIYNTTGKFYPLKGDWEGDKGISDWGSTSLDPTKNYAEFTNYSFKVKNNHYKVDSVTLVTQFYPEPLLGRFRNKLEQLEDRRPSFPSFDSYSKRLTVDNVFAGIKFEGGFSIVGERLRGTGTEKAPALITVVKNNMRFFTATSTVFLIYEDKIVSNQAAIKFRLDKDSITHPGLKFRVNYDKSQDEAEIALIRNEEGKEKSPYFNTFHRLEMDVEAVYWRINEHTVHFRGMRQGKSNSSAGTRKDAFFESMDYFSPERYDMLRGLDNVHPLVQMVKTVKVLDTNRFQLVDLARTMQINTKAVEPLVLRLSLLGFIDYSTETKEIYVRDKVFKYVWAAAEKEDYDQIVFSSNVNIYKNLNKFNKSHDIDITGIDVQDQDNAKLNLLNYDLTIRGLEKVVISTEQYAQVWPRRYELVVRKNRDFEGAMIADVGYFNFYCSSLAFNYDRFEFELKETDSTKLNTLGYPSEYGESRGRYRVRNKIMGVKGTVQIDHPSNKSGTKQEEYPTYPILTTKSESRVTYDGKSTQNGAYLKEEFYFEMQPFSRDSLDDFLPEDFVLKGKLYSAGIFPEFEEELKIQKDYSLGFIRKTPEDGLALYESKGSARFYDEIRLSNDGLKGSGEIKYQNALAESNDYTFLPDSTFGFGDIHNQEKLADVDQPEAVGKDVLIAYHPAEDLMSATTTEEPIDMMFGQAFLDGTLMIEPSGLTGKGFFDMIKGTMTSDKFSFKHKIADADTASFELASMDGDILAIKTTNVNAHVDFDKREGVFKANGDDTRMDLDAVQYICFMDVLKWKMDIDQIEMENSKKVEEALSIDTDYRLAKSNFFSVHPDQDSLNFMSGKARYDLKTGRLDCEKIPYIAIADAQIIPDSGQTTIRRDANMDTLRNASITANYVTRYHNLYDVNIKLKSRLMYQGYGKVNYVDENNESHPIRLTKLSVDPSAQTYAYGDITEEEEFKLSPQFGYKGKVELYANFEHLSFNGSATIYHDCDSIPTAFFDFEGLINPLDVMIPVEQEKLAGKILDIGTGIVLNDASVKLYPAFLSKKTEKKHHDLISAYGFLKYNKTSNEYEISNESKLMDRNQTGNFVSLDVKNCMLFGDGTFDYGLNTGLLDMKGYGRGSQNIVSKEFSFTGALIADIPIDKSITDKMAELILETAQTAVDVSNTSFEKAMREVMPAEKVDKMYSNFLSSGKLKYQEEMGQGIFFAKTKMNWYSENSRYKGYKSRGKIQIATIGEKSVFRSVNGTILLNKKRNGTNDMIYIYLDAGDGLWFYLEYQGQSGFLTVHSSDVQFNEFVIGLKKDAKEVKSDVKGVKKMIIMPGSDKKVKDFKRRMES